MLREGECIIKDFLPLGGLEVVYLGYLILHKPSRSLSKQAREWVSELEREWRREALEVYPALALRCKKPERLMKRWRGLWVPLSEPAQYAVDDSTRQFTMHQQQSGFLRWALQWQETEIAAVLMHCVGRQTHLGYAVSTVGGSHTNEYIISDQLLLENATHNCSIKCLLVDRHTCLASHCVFLQRKC